MMAESTFKNACREKGLPNICYKIARIGLYLNKVALQPTPRDAGSR